MSYETLHSRLISLDEDTRLKGLWLIATAADAGIPLRISQGHRTLEEQAALRVFLGFGNAPYGTGGGNEAHGPLRL